MLFWNYQNRILQFPKPDSPIFLILPNLIINRYQDKYLYVSAHTQTCTILIQWTNDINW
jgi:hypothetical protein